MVSKLIVNQHFPRLAEELKSFVAGTNSAAIASYNQVMKITGRMLQQQGKIMPHDKTNARNALRDVQAHMIPPEVPDMTMIRTAFELVLGDLKKEADVCVQNTTKVTGSILDDMIRRLDKRRDKPDLRQLTVNDITDAIMEQISGADIPDEEREKIRENLVGIFQSVSRTSVTKSRGKK